MMSDDKPVEHVGYGDDYGESFGAFGGNVDMASEEDQKKKSAIPGLPNMPTMPNMPSIPKIPVPGKVRDKLDSLFTNINYDLLVAKTFYFFFFAAFGSLFPLIAVYFKQLGMNPAQTGLLIGFRPFVEWVSGPFWSNIADRWNKWKQILLFSLFCWVAFTLALAFIAPPANSCLVYNGTDIVVIRAWEVQHEESKYKDPNYETNRKFVFLPHPSIDAYGKSPLPLDHKDVANLNSESHAEGLVSPPMSAVVYKSRDIQSTFLLILILMIIGEFLSAPAIELADAATIGYLENDPENYGRQRMLGSVGWALSMFFVGIALDHSNIFPNHPCGNEQLVDRNYTVCFAVFSVLMCCAFLAATQFRFNAEQHSRKDVIPLTDFKEKVIDKVTQKIQGRIRGEGNAPTDDTPSPYGHGYDSPARTDSGQPQGGAEANGAAGDKKIQISLQGDDGQITDGGDMISDAQTSGVSDANTKPMTFIPRGRPGQSGRLPEWVTVLKIFANIQHGSALFILWWMGLGVGLVFAFLFWHLQDLTGTPTLFGIASVINHLSEIVAYLFSRRLISRFGHLKVLYAGMLGNVARFLYVSWLRNPWWVLPFEFLQGLTHAAVWAAGCSYLSQGLPEHLRPTGQGVLAAVHHGLGRAFGTIVGGAFVNAFGSEAMFRGYGIATIFLFGAYLALNYFYISRYLGVTPGPESSVGLVEEGTHLAPYGVPMSMHASRSNTNIDDGKQYGATTGTGNSGPFLQPGGVNPPPQQQQQPRQDPYGNQKQPVDYGYGDDPVASDFVQYGQLSLKTKTKNTNQQQDMYYDPKPAQRPAVVMSAPPRPNTETHMMQPAPKQGGHYDEEDWY